MQNPDLHPIIIFLLIFESVLLFAQVLFVWARPKVVSRRRFLILLLTFLQFTLLCGTMPSESINISIINQTIIVYASSIVLAAVYFWYLSTELELPQLKLYNIKVLTITLFVAFTLFFIATFLITKDLFLARRLFIVLPIILALYFCFQTIRFLVQKWRRLKHKTDHHSAIILSGNIGIVFMATMPVTDVFDKTLNQTLNITLVSVSLMAAFYAYIKNHVRQSRLEYQFLQKLGYLQIDGSNNEYKTTLEAYKLTARELDVALLILEGKSYRLIGDDMFLNHKTISKHGSNIFRKTNCKNKNEFIARFSDNQKNRN